jgi:hypothetical protein
VDDGVSAMGRHLNGVGAKEWLRLSSRLVSPKRRGKAMFTGLRKLRIQDYNRLDQRRSPHISRHPQACNPRMLLKVVNFGDSPASAVRSAMLLALASAGSARAGTFV